MYVKEKIFLKNVSIAARKMLPGWIQFWGSFDIFSLQNFPNANYTVKTVKIYMLLFNLKRFLRFNQNGFFRSKNTVNNLV